MLLLSQYRITNEAQNTNLNQPDSSKPLEFTQMKKCSGLEILTLSEKVSGVSVMTSALINSIGRQRRTSIIMGATSRTPSVIVANPNISSSPTSLPI